MINIENQLRRGNIIKCCGRTTMVCSISGKSITVGSGLNDPSHTFELNDRFEILPELLNEEWIKKMPAFKKHWLDKHNHSEGHYYCIKLNKNKYCDLALMSGDKNGFFEVCLFPYNDHFRWQYVHEVQNIYQDLVKMPLEIKL